MLNDTIIQDIVDIFKLDKVELVRLSGLVKREHLDAVSLHLIIYKLKQANVIDYKISCYCPHCREIFYLKKEEKEHRCDTCGLMFDINLLNIINEKDISKIINI